MTPTWLDVADDSPSRTLCQSKYNKIQSAYPSTSKRKLILIMLTCVFLVPCAKARSKFSGRENTKRKARSLQKYTRIKQRWRNSENTAPNSVQGRAKTIRYWRKIKKRNTTSIRQQKQWHSLFTCTNSVQKKIWSLIHGAKDEVWPGKYPGWTVVRHWSETE